MGKVREGPGAAWASGSGKGESILESTVEVETTGKRRAHERCKEISLHTNRSVSKEAKLKEMLHTDP